MFFSFIIFMYRHIGDSQNLKSIYYFFSKKHAHWRNQKFSYQSCQLWKSNLLESTAMCGWSPIFRISKHTNLYFATINKRSLSVWAPRGNFRSSAHSSKQYAQYCYEGGLCKCMFFRDHICDHICSELSTHCFSSKSEFMFGFGVIRYFLGHSINWSKYRKRFTFSISAELQWTCVYIKHYKFIWLNMLLKLFYFRLLFQGLDGCRKKTNLGSIRQKVMA